MSMGILTVAVNKVGTPKGTCGVGSGRGFCWEDCKPVKPVTLFGHPPGWFT
jgi:hypothetical protein